MQQNGSWIRKTVLALLWALAVAALCVQMSVPAADSAAEASVAWTRTMQNSEVWLAAALSLGLGFMALGRQPRAFSKAGLWVVAVLAAGVATLGESFAATGTAELALASKPAALVYFAGRVPLYYMGMRLLLAALTKLEASILAPARKAYAMPPDLPRAEQKAAQTPQQGRRTAQQMQSAYPSAEAYHQAIAAAASGANTRAAHVRPAVRKGLPTWGYMLLLLACWLPYLFVVWPGTVSNDTITQLAEIVGSKPLSNGNPVFQTGLVWLAANIGKGLFQSADAAIALYVCAQALLMAWLLSYTIQRIKESGAPKWLVWVTTVFFAVNPIFPVFAFCVGKDTNFAMATLWFTLMVWRLVDSKWPPLRTVFGLCASAVLCVLLRNAGVALVGITLAALLVWALVKGERRWRAPLVSGLCVAVAMAVLYMAVLPKLAAEPTPETENWSVPLQQVARVVASAPLTDEERVVIDAVMPVDDIQTAYNGELSDPVKNLWRTTVTKEQKSAFFGQWLKLGLKHPATYLSATFHNSYGYLLPGYVSTIKPTFLMGMEGRTTQIDGLFDFTVNPRANEVKKVLQGGFAYAPFRLLTAPGLYGMLTLFAVAGILTYRRKKNLLCMLPALFTLLGCLLSAVNGYYRYAMPLYFMAPVLLALVSQTGRGEERRPIRR